MVYYCGKLFADSFIGRQLLQAGVSTADLYARVPLLLAPSKDFVPFWRTVDGQPDVLAAGIHEVEDGRSEVGIGIPVYYPVQFRRVLRTAAESLVAINIVQTTAARDLPPRLNARR